ncbi:hypothetical protein [Chitinivibrio alkaliphilus]|uniref:Uncharacterized protein n=1 Tax=Chitinivibrio alkaliphilus ACht1 TaxID=1313304 RepID=U7DAM1_9BACT|nr:hypothetical protein [Chitinivibrio alkaliphilus]ERP32177.1 hypothetical protein CALK_0907 [Chitinivibrio alkaliphilus ACht1]
METHRDTITVDAGTRGPLFLSPYHINSETITIETQDSLLLPAWTYAHGQNALYFESPLRQKTTLYISYTRLYPDIRRMYMRYTDHGKDSAAHDLTTRASPRAAQDSESIRIEGSSGITLAVGQGRSTIEQDLTITLAGSITDSTKISGSIVDKNSSLEGGTRAIGELDRIFIHVENPRWEVFAGDIEITPPPSFRQDPLYPTGIGGTLTYEHGYTTIYGGLTTVQRATQYFQGKTGIQGGIYRLDGEHVGPLYLVPGSVDVSINGVPLSEGRDTGHYYVDYGESSIHFTNRKAIRETHLIQVQYSYQNSVYDKATTGIHSTLAAPDSTLITEAMLHIFGDTPSRSTMEYSPEEQDRLAKSTGESPRILSGREVPRDEIPQMLSRYRLYKRHEETRNYFWKPPEEARTTNVPIYTVQFSPDPEGTYLPYDPTSPEKFSSYDSLFLARLESYTAKTPFLEDIYLYVGEGGRYSAEMDAILPKQTATGAARIKYTPHEQIGIQSHMMGELRNPNTFNEALSPHSTGGISTSLQLSTDVDNLWITTVESHLTAFDSLFDRTQMVNYHDLARQWDISQDNSLSLFLWQQDLSLSYAQRLFLTLSGGQIHSTVEKLGNRYGGEIALRTHPILQTSYAVQRNEMREETLRQQAFSAEMDRQNLQLLFSAEERWRTTPEPENNYGELEARLTTKLRSPLRVKTSLNRHTQRRGGETHRTARDSFSLTSLEQELAHDISPNHHIAYHGTYTVRTEGDQDQKSVLLSITDRQHRLNNRLSSYIQYTTRSESSREKNWEYTPVPKGTGTHSRDSLTGQFVPDEYGDYLAREITLWSDDDSPVISNAFLWDVAYSSGTADHSYGWSLNFSIHEDMHDTTQGVSKTRLPGYATLSQNVDSVLYTFTELHGETYWYRHAAKAQHRLSNTMSHRASRGDTLHSIRPKAETKKS